MIRVKLQPPIERKAASQPQCHHFEHFREAPFKFFGSTALALPHCPRKREKPHASTRKGKKGRQLYGKGNARKRADRKPDDSRPELSLRKSLLGNELFYPRLFRVSRKPARRKRASFGDRLQNSQGDHSAQRFGIGNKSVIEPFIAIARLGVLASLRVSISPLSLAAICEHPSEACRRNERGENRGRA